MIREPVEGTVPPLGQLDSRQPGLQLALKVFPAWLCEAALAPGSRHHAVSVSVWGLPCPRSGMAPDKPGFSKKSAKEAQTITMLVLMLSMGSSLLIQALKAPPHLLTCKGLKLRDATVSSKCQVKKLVQFLFISQVSRHPGDPFLEQPA